LDTLAVKVWDEKCAISRGTSQPLRGGRILSRHQSSDGPDECQWECRGRKPCWLAGTD